LRTKPTTKLLTHRTVARMVDIDTETLREWVAVGEWPEPHAIVRQTWFYRADAIDHFLETGRWPDGTKFKAGEGKGRD
jgi:uncharacterized protein YeaC (DUF1315 family)